MADFSKEYLECRKAVIKKDFGRMNDMQFNAVTTVKGPVLVLAGAGSGKTTVLVNRIACLIKYGDAYNSDYIPSFSGDRELKMMKDYLNGVTEELDESMLAVDEARPSEILAITFTNKAANELKNRISLKLGSNADGIWAGTFHSVCARILRRFGDVLGYSRDYTIYDTEDQKKLVKEILKGLYIDEKMFPIRTVLNEISRAKDELLTPEQLKENYQNDVRLKKIAEIYKEYQLRLQRADAMDFDDLIVNTVRLFQKSEDTLEYYQNKFKYIMVDEYQDTNHAQYVLVSLLAKKYGNFCVVGDDDQSIYRFRGATIENILSFEDEYENSLVIRLEQNYRSTANILDAANAVIANNRNRKGKNLWTSGGEGEKIKIKTLPDGRSEAKYVADMCLDFVAKGEKFGDSAVLYRTNAQSNAIESVFVRSGIPYKMIGGLRFFDRKEIKDIISYLSIINNKNDDVRLRRIINEPRRGIGDTTINTAAQIASGNGISLYSVLKNAADYPQLSRASGKLGAFVNMIEELTESAKTLPLSELTNEIIEKSGYMLALIALGDDGKERIENLKELSTSIIQYEQENTEPTLGGFLEEVALVNDIDNYDENSDAVVLMTVHSAKGLEFPNVFLVGMEEGLFPSNQSIYGDESDIEEERRLAYVALTRAKNRLFVLNAYTRMIYGQTNRNRPSRFAEEIPRELCDTEGFSPMGSYDGVTFSTGGNSYGYGSGYSSGSYQSDRGSKPVRSIYAQSKLNTPKTANTVKYKTGQRVKHKVFGEGMVISAIPMGNDTLLEVAFDTKGTKKIMANFSKMQILD